MKTEYKVLLNFESVSVMTSTSIATLSSTQDALGEGTKGAVRESFTFEIIEDAQRKIRNAPSAIPGTTRSMTPLFTVLFHPSPNGRMEMDSLSRVRIAQVVQRPYIIETMHSSTLPM